MTQESAVRTSKYIKPAREEKIFEKTVVFFLFSLFVMPQYFGLPTPLFDFTLLRMMLILVLFMIIYDDERKVAFADLILHSRLTLVLLPYMFVLLYTMVLRADINAFLNPFLEILSFYLLIYVIQNVLGVEKTVRYLLGFLYLMTIFGVVEYAMGRSPFSYLETIKGIYTGRFIRSGNYRIMSSCTHSLGYGLLLVAVAPLSCFDYRKNEVNLLCRPILFLLLLINVFLTGSRSTLSVFLVETLLLFILSSGTDKKKCILAGIVLVAGIAAFLVVFYRTGIAQYILLQFASILDSILGTQYSVLFGGNTEALSSSSNYRDQLKYIFQVKWLNPILGIGRKRSFTSEINGSYIESIDNFYIAEYVRYAYPGLVTYVFFLLFHLGGMIKKCIMDGKAVYKILLVGAGCYAVNLFWVDSLQTLKYLYIIFALYLCQYMEDGRSAEADSGSKYIRSRVNKWR